MVFRTQLNFQLNWGQNRILRYFFNILGKFECDSYLLNWRRPPACGHAAVIKGQNLEIEKNPLKHPFSPLCIHFPLLTFTSSSLTFSPWLPNPQAASTKDTKGRNKIKEQRNKRILDVCSCCSLWLNRFFLVFRLFCPFSA